MAHEFVVKQGETRTLLVTVKSAAGAPVDLTGALCSLGVKKAATDDEYILHKDSSFFDYGEAAQGSVSVTLTSYDTLRDPGVYWLEVECVMDNGKAQKTVADYFLKIKTAILQPHYIEVAGGFEVAMVISGETD